MCARLSANDGGENLFERARSEKALKTEELPLELAITCTSFCGSRPAVTPSISPSAAAAALQKAIMLLTSLATVPVPSSPMWITLALNDCRTGRASSNTFLSPPTMMAMVAASAPTVPPLTGASSMAMPLAAMAAPILFTIDGALVLRSM